MPAVTPRVVVVVVVVVEVTLLTPTAHNSDLRDTHEYLKKQLWGERK